VFLEIIILPLGRRIPRISSSSAFRGSSSSHKGISPSSKRKSIVKESIVVKHTKQMALSNLLMIISTKPLVPLLLQVWLLLSLPLILFLPSLNQELEHPSSLISSLSNAVMPYKCLGKISDILHLNNENNQLERQAWPPKDVPLDAQSWT